MGLISTGISAIGKLLIVGSLVVAFGIAMVGVVYMSLTGQEIKVPEITGKDFVESEKELASLGLKIKKRADRLSSEKMNTVLEQLPKAGETVKTGQLILVVVSKAGLEGEETPKSLLDDIDADDSQKIEDMISDKPKKAKPVANTKKKVDASRDVIGNTDTGKDATGDGDKTSDDTKSDDATDKKGDKSTKVDKDGKGDKSVKESPGTSGKTPPAKKIESEKPTLRNRP